MSGAPIRHAEMRVQYAADGPPIHLAASEGEYFRDGVKVEPFDWHAEWDKAVWRTDVKLKTARPPCFLESLSAPSLP